MRKLLVALIAVAIFSSLTACGKKGDVKPPKDYSSETEQTG